MDRVDRAINGDLTGVQGSLVMDVWACWSAGAGFVAGSCKVRDELIVEAKGKRN